jgi:8-oxo-dGTP pyrophosphatase MutT (NUDIX family)
MPTRGSSVVILNDRHEVLLILREDAHIWALPAGHVEPGETYEQAAIRETREETGYEVALDRPVGEYWRPQYPHGGNTQRVFAGHVTGGDPSRHDWESLDVKWFPLDALPWRLYPFAREQIVDACVRAAAPIKKVQKLPWPQLLLLQFFLGYRRIRNRLRALPRAEPSIEREDR